MNDIKDQIAPNPSKVNPTVTIVIDGNRVGFKHNLTNLEWRERRRRRAR